MSTRPDISCRKYQSIFESARQPIVLVDPQWTIRANAPAASLFGMRPGSAEGTSLNELLPARQPDEHDSRSAIAWRARAALRGWPQLFDWRFRRLDGALFDSHVTLARADWAEPGTLQLVVSVERGPWEAEASRLRELAQRSRTQETVGRLAGGIAHDFNNLLTAIVGQAQLLGAGELASEDREALREIESAAFRAAEIVRKLLAFSGRQSRAQSLVDPNELIGRIRTQIETLMGGDITVTTRLGADLGQVCVDPAHLEQAILAIALNAREAMPSGGSLDIATYTLLMGPSPFPGLPETPAGLWTVLSISDTGSGMDPAASARLFEPYVTSREWVIGAGLGLAAVSGTVRQNGGHVEAHSRPGHGTEIIIYLPRA